MLEDPDTIFARIARDRRLLDDDQIELLRGLQALDRMCGRRRTLAVLAVTERAIAPDQAAAVMRAVRYCRVRQADRAYGRIAARRGLVPLSLVDGLLEDQRRAFYDRGILQRLSRILLVAGAISPEQDEEVKREVLGRSPAAAPQQIVPAA